MKSPVVRWMAMLVAFAAPVAADGFWDQASALLAQGDTVQASALAQDALAANGNNADALVILGTARLIDGLVARNDDSIFRPTVDTAAKPTYNLTPEGADAVAALWKRVPALDPARAYLWGDLAQLTFRSGDSSRALEFASQALTSRDPGALKAAATVFVLNLDFAKAAAALTQVPGSRSALLWQGLDAWRTAKDGWKVTLKAFVDNPGDDPAGAKLAAYLIGPAMRDTEAGFLEAMKVESGPASLAVKWKYADRYPGKLLAKLDLARTLAQFGSFAKAIDLYLEIDKRALAATPDEKQAVLFQEAWAFQGAGRQPEANRLWALVAESKDFYLRSAAAWFLGADALARNKPADAADWWSRVADEPARSKYAFWADQSLRKLRNR